MNLIRKRPHSVREFFGICNKFSRTVPLGHRPTVIDHNIAVACGGKSAHNKHCMEAKPLVGAIAGKMTVAAGLASFTPCAAQSIMSTVTKKALA